ncbi:hypothetical protein [Shimia sp. SDUM112013]|uniref:hypothetical protein n=1 Tax=Shimia sp. SDUM112013 TaxID=3136160 RepID=UPI0032EACED4
MIDTDQIMSGNLLTEAVFTPAGQGGNALTLPGLMAAMARGEVQGLTRMRPHQRPAWHMFLVQLAALALWTAGREEPPGDETEWAALLRGLTPDFEGDAPWCLAVTDRTKPAFLQPPDPGELKWSPVPTPDALDMVITSRNHDLKTRVAMENHPQDWVFALVSLQTMEGFGGAGNYGIARMNGGSSSRPILGLAPAGRDAHSVDESLWWQRDVHQLLTNRAAGAAVTPCTVGGTALVWLLDWPAKASLDPVSLDPWFIEICRHIRLWPDRGGYRAERATSKGTRIQAKAFKGVLFEPWGPVHRTENKLLTVGDRDFNYRLLHQLLFGGDWDAPLLARHHADDPDDMVLVAEAFSRGNSKTDGFRSRLVPVSRKVVRRVLGTEARNLSEQQMEDIADVSKALRWGLAMMACGGRDEGPSKDAYAAAQPAQIAFDRVVDGLFFPALWAQLEVAGGTLSERAAARRGFTDQLKVAARRCFEDALPGVTCPSIYRPRAEARAWRAFEGALRKINASQQGTGGASDDAA